MEHAIKVSKESLMYIHYLLIQSNYLRKTATQDIGNSNLSGLLKHTLNACKKTPHPQDTPPTGNEDSQVVASRL